MFDLVGNVVVKSDKRLSYLLATIRSFEFIRSSGMVLFLNVDTDNEKYQKIIKTTLEDSLIIHFLNFETGLFGDIYTQFINDSEAKYLLHFEEDHFCSCDSVDQMLKMMDTAEKYDIDVIKATFFKLERNIYKDIGGIMSGSGLVLKNTPNAFKRSQAKEKRFYLGNNAFFKRDFALKYWGRKVDTKKPHSFELREYYPEFEHMLLVPNFEILTPIDDNHGVPNTCLLDNPNEKWKRIYG